MSSVDFLKNIFSANILTNDFWRRHLALIILILAAIFAYIYVDYSCMLKEYEIADLKKQIETIHNEMLVYSSEFTNLTRPSSLSKILKDRDNPIKEANTPPIKIK